MKKDVLIVHYNTPELTAAAIRSLNKSTDGCKVWVFDNSDERPFDETTLKSVGTAANVRVVDNTKQQLVNFDEELAKYPDKWERDVAKSNYGSAKHAMSVDYMMDVLKSGFVLMDSDVIVKQDISPLWDKSYAAVGTEQVKSGVPLLQPFLCYLNVPVLKKHKIRYYNGEKMWALSNKEPNQHYDTGAWLLEELRRCNLAVNYVNIKKYVSHFGHGSWRGSEERVEKWLNDNRIYWDDGDGNVKIFVCTHTDFELPVSNPVYQVIDMRDLEKISPKGDGAVSGLFYSELLAYKWAVEHNELPDYVGFCQYRKYFDFMDDVPDMTKLFEEYDCVTTTPRQFNESVYSQYRRCFNPFDMDVMKAVVCSSNPDFWPTFKASLEGDTLYTGNMVIMRKEDFVEMIDTVWDLLSNWLEAVGYDIEDRIDRYRQIYLRNGGRNGTVDYQYRIGGNLGERLISAYIMWKFKKVKTFDKKITEPARR